MKVNPSRERRRKELSQKDANYQCFAEYKEKCSAVQEWQLNPEQMKRFLRQSEPERTLYLHSLHKKERENHDDNS